MNNKKKNEKGAVLVESGFVTVLVLTLVFSFLDLGRAVWTKNAVTYLAREGTRYAIVRGKSVPVPATETSVRQRVLARSFALDRSMLAVNVSWPLGNQPGRPVRVQVSYPMTPYLPFVPHTVMTMRSQSEMIIAQ